jgi:hypothetical protein
MNNLNLQRKPADTKLQETAMAEAPIKSTKISGNFHQKEVVVADSQRREN